jgi:hydroxypyruvate isomerase
VPFARAADTLALVEAVGRPGLRMMLDLYHAQIGEGKPIELLRRAGRLGYRGTVGLEAWASGDSERALAGFRAAFTRPEPPEPRGAGP